MKLTKELVPADVLQEIFDSPIPYRDAAEEKLTKVSLDVNNLSSVRS